MGTDQCLANLNLTDLSLTDLHMNLALKNLVQDVTALAEDLALAKALKNGAKEKDPAMENGQKAQATENGKKALAMDKALAMENGKKAPKEQALAMENGKRAPEKASDLWRWNDRFSDENTRLSTSVIVWPRSDYFY